jgi:hypothetical protein
MAEAEPAVRATSIPENSRKLGTGRVPAAEETGDGRRTRKKASARLVGEAHGLLTR